jgi:diaminohydroxyphosphoribosylaminopyrimidine deaminase/5-amino-6-(5-phosphoribosylamino)uracil reductase
LIEAKVARVVVGCFDPNPAVDGKGADELRQAGIVVDGPVLEDQCRQLIAPFIAGITYHRPYVTLKWAQTADGKIAGPGGARLQISSPASTRLVHQLRARSDAIMVGVNTVITDDPLLTAREVPASRDLLRVVLDSRLRIPLESRLIKSFFEGQPLFIYHGKGASQNRAWPYVFDAGVIEMPDSESGGLSLSAILRDLNGRRTAKHFGRPVTQILVEPGPTLAGSFFRENLVDRVWVFRSPNAFNDAGAPAAARVPEHYALTGESRVDGDTLTEYLNPRSPVFFAAEASADLVLARNTG